MSAALERSLIPITEYDELREGRSIVRQEALALEQVAQRLDAAFCAAVEMLAGCRGSVIVCGMGKAGLIGQKIAATLSSTGTRAHFLHPAEAVHGDLGCLHAADVLLALSNSGETEEVNQLLPAFKRLRIPLIAVTSSEQNTLASQADVTIRIGRLKEACPWGLAPSTSTTAMLAVGDALALVVSRRKGFSPQHFAELHPAGSLGRKLKPVTEVMRSLEMLRVAPCTTSVREVFTQYAMPGRRSGAILLLDDDGRLAGMFTDSDLARLLERRRDDCLDRPIGDVMNRTPLTVSETTTLAQVIDLLSERKISELPVVDEEHRPVGLIDITDVIGWLPAQANESGRHAPS
jgi:arabinose-5-phosphate isomerase